MMSWRCEMQFSLLFHILHVIMPLKVCCFALPLESNRPLGSGIVQFLRVQSSFTNTKLVQVPTIITTCTVAAISFHSCWAHITPHIPGKALTNIGNTNCVTTPWKGSITRVIRGPTCCTTTTTHTWDAKNTFTWGWVKPRRTRRSRKLLCRLSIKILWWLRLRVRVVHHGYLRKGVKKK